MKTKKIKYSIEIEVATDKNKKDIQLDIIKNINIGNLHNVFAEVCNLEQLNIVRVV
jgi:hypothetical protein